ncbi:MAG: addiction module protein [Planctomycetia bacterium]|nr:addiction module protein [Planctomycetia bacterium]
MLKPNPSFSPARLAREAHRLKPRERASLALRLLASLEPESERDVEDAWEKEIARRVREMESGKAKMVPWSAIRRKLISIERRAR